VLAGNISGAAGSAACTRIQGLTTTVHNCACAADQALAWTSLTSARVCRAIQAPTCSWSSRDRDRGLQQVEAGRDHDQLARGEKPLQLGPRHARGFQVEFGGQ